MNNWNAKIFIGLGVICMNAFAQQNYSGIEGEIVFENDHVVIQRFSMAPGDSAGPHTHPGKQMEILLVDGVGIIYEADGKEVKLDMKAGDIRWIDAQSEPHDFKNVGEGPVDWYLIDLKSKDNTAS